MREVPTLIGGQFSGCPKLAWRYDLLALFVFALLLRVTVLWSSLGQLGAEAFLTITPDTGNYLEAARAILSGSGSAENVLFTFGPGFPYLLSLQLRLFGESPVPILVLQIVLSALSCLLIYRLAMQIVGDYFIALLAGAIAACSLTSISLSCLILSDTIFFFLFALSLTLFIDGVRDGRWWQVVIAGGLLGGSILIRSIGQFWPVGMLIVGVALLSERTGSIEVKSLHRNQRLRQVGICFILSIVPMVGWTLRNGAVNGVFTLAKTSAGGPANVAAMTLESQTGTFYRAIQDEWYSQAKQQAGVQQLNVLLDGTRTINRGHEFVWLSLVGLAALLWKRRFAGAVILGMLFLYFAAIIGFTKWQGSRLFYPALIPGAILCAIAAVTIARYAYEALGAVNTRLEIGRRVSLFFDRSSESNRRYLILTAVSIAAALTVLFRKFIFSSMMLQSVDVLGLGLAHHRLLLEHFLRTHSLPGWTPYPMGGVPFVEAISGAVFYPLSIIEYIGYVPRMIGFNFIFHFFLSGVFMFLTARQFKLSPPASLVTGVAYAFSPLMISWVAPGHDGKIYCATLFPLLVLFVDRLLNDGHVRNAIFAGVVLGAMVVTPHVQMVMYSIAFVVAFTLYRLAPRVLIEKSWKTVFRSLGLMVGVAVVGLGLSAVQWLPSLQYIPRESPRSYEQPGVEYATTFSLHPEEALSLGIPEFCGLDEIDRDRTYWGRNSFKDNSESLGPIVCLLALLALLLPGTPQKYWWLTIGAMTTLYALGTHTVVFRYLTSSLPLLSQVRAPSTAMFIALFAASMLAGIGTENARQALAIDSNAKKRLFIFVGAAVALLFVACLLILFKGRGALMYYGTYLYPALSESSIHGSQLRERMMENLPFLQVGLWRAWLLIVGVTALLWLYMRKQSAFLLAGGVVCLMFVATGQFVSRCIKLIDPAVYYEPKPVTNFLAERVGIDRVVGFALNQTSYLIGTYPIQSSIGYHSRPIAWYYRLSGEEPARNFMNARFANLVGTRFIVFPNRPDCSLNLDTLGLIRMDTSVIFDECIVFENHNAFPRTFMVDSFVVMDSCWPAIIETVNGRTDLRRVALLEQPPDIPIHHAADTTARATIDYYDDDTISISVSCETNQLLILTDTWYSAWRASVDGKPAEILRVDGAFRAVPVPAGSKKVDFAFHSPYVRAGAITSLTTLSVIASIGLGALFLRRKRNANRPSRTG